MQNVEFLRLTILGNTIQAYLAALLLFVGALVVLRVLEKVVIHRLQSFCEKRAVKVDPFFFEILQKTVVPLLYVSAFYFAAVQLALHPVVENLVHGFCIVVATIQVTRLALTLAILLLEKTWFKKVTAQGGTVASASILTLVRVVVWGLGIVFILDNLGFNVSAVIAGLGIGGIAVALAAQTILGDLFNYFVIFFDKPFQEGDSIVVGEYAGTIEHIGIKTTRIRSESGEQIVFSNTDLTSSRIRNYKRMDRRRSRFQLGVAYQTSNEQLKKIPGMVREIIQGIEGTAFERAHFKNFGSSTLDFEVVYFVSGSDYEKYMNVQQRINLAIKDAFEKEGIEFAYPTQTIYEYKVPVKT